MMQKEEKNRIIKREKSGGKNLILLGALSTLIAILTTGVSLMIYHNSGDIYLDRSRPGFLPDEEEAQEEKIEEEEYNFSRSGKITGEALDEFLKNLDIEVQAIDARDDQFGEATLSNERLGIPEPAETEEP